MTRELCYREDDRAMRATARYICGPNESLRRYGHSKLYNSCRQLGFL